MKRANCLSAQSGDQRYEDERPQGIDIASGVLEGVWGWSSSAGRHADRRARFLIAGHRP